MHSSFIPFMMNVLQKGRMKYMFKKMKKGAGALVLSVGLLVPATALAASSYTVVSGDSLWKIAVKTQTGVQELINANPQLKNPDLIIRAKKLTYQIKKGKLMKKK